MFWSHPVFLLLLRPQLIFTPAPVFPSLSSKAASSPGTTLVHLLGPQYTPRNKSFHLIFDQMLLKVMVGENMFICLRVTFEGQISRYTFFFRGTSGPQFHPGGPLAARRLFLQQWNRPPVQRQTSRRTERRCDRAVVQLTWPPCEKRSAEEDDLREETGDKEGSVATKGH